MEKSKREFLGLFGLLEYAARFGDYPNRARPLTPNPEIEAAAEAKRQRKQFRNLRNEKSRSK